MKYWSVHEELTGAEVGRLQTAESTVAIEFAEPGLCALPVVDPGDLLLDRAAAPNPEDIIATMRANGLHDPERDGS